MNSYFATVEQQANPLLRGKPVGVCAYLSERGCIIAASREAKLQGVSTGMRVFAARQICPKIVLVENDPPKYRFVSKSIFSLLKKVSDEVEIYSIDEAFIDLTGLVKDYQTAENIARRLKVEIKECVGSWLTCSVGIAPTRWLAKFASEEQKPDGLTVIRREDLKTIFTNRPLQHAWGIASKLEKRLKSIGIYTLGDLQKASAFYLKENLGMYGYYLWCHVNGIEVERVDTTRGNLPKSIGHSYCVPQQTTDKKYLQGIMAKLALRAASRMRSFGMQTNKIMCGFSYVYHGGVWHSWRLPVALYNSSDIVRESARIFSHSIEQKVRLIAVSLRNLTPISNQLSLFSSQIKNTNLTQAIDKLNQRYGEFTILPGSVLPFTSYAPDRIGFRKSVMLENIEQ